VPLPDPKKTPAPTRAIVCERKKSQLSSTGRGGREAYGVDEELGEVGGTGTCEGSKRESKVKVRKVVFQGGKVDGNDRGVIDRVSAFEKHRTVEVGFTTARRRNTDET
jgi:hypothetical protein